MTRPRLLPCAVLLLAAFAARPGAGDWSTPQDEGVRLPRAPGATEMVAAEIAAVLRIDRDGRVLVQVPAESAGMVEVRGLMDLAGFLAAVAGANTREGSPASDAAVLLQADESTRWEAIGGLLAACASQRLRRISFAVALEGGMGRLPVDLPLDRTPPEPPVTSVRLSLAPAADGLRLIAIGRKRFDSPAELTTALETLQALFPGLRLILNVHPDYPYRDLVHAVGLARATGFPGVEFSSSFVDPDLHPLVNTGIIFDSTAVEAGEVDPRNRGSAEVAAGENPATLPVATAEPSVTRGPDRSALLRTWGGGEATERAVHAGLGWLVRHQAADGCWSSHAYGERCNSADACPGKGYKSYDVGVSALALYALVSAGHLPGAEVEPTYSAAAGLALRGLLGRQGESGAIGPGDILKPLYNHAVATLALCETLRRGAGDLSGPAQQAVDFLVAARSPAKAWRYKPQAAEHDTSVTGWALSALLSARAAGLRVDPGVFRELVDFFDEVTDPRYSRVGYTSREDAGLKITVPGRNENYINHDTMSAIGTLSQVLLGNRARAPRLEFQVELVGQDLPRWDKVHLTNDYYYWYYGTAALQAWGLREEKDRQRWERWNAALVKALVDHQASAGCAAGSWDADDRWSFEGGRVYGTALNVLTLESYYRVPALLGGE